eukprot:TRINITY_DN4428_c0_g1::TRINITY_DN4428_c0_g1_i1::g.7260::m.7260 TRINITY_DN4428_c0_g1::TRINITY_DN4428_c0_g1_i1::g.7260  ORF type:complete len:109 (+),score=11.34 TRINITY_DN4428_c0_g1_i1:131-457(+)
MSSHSKNETLAPIDTSSSSLGLNGSFRRPRTSDLGVVPVPHHVTFAQTLEPSGDYDENNESTDGSEGSYSDDELPQIEPQQTSHQQSEHHQDKKNLKNLTCLISLIVA